MPLTILHSHLNGFNTSVEALHRPKLRGKPMAVSGDAEQRHGIILAKNEEFLKANGITPPESEFKTPNTIFC